VTWPHRPYRKWQPEDTWKRVFALPILVTGFGVGLYTFRRSGPRPLPVAHTMEWIAFSLLFLCGQVAYCRRYRVGFDWFNSRWSVFGSAWILRTILFPVIWLVGFEWLPPNPVGFTEYVINGTCLSAVCIGAAALWGIDLEQT
jgi:hypothetical protein